jgi:carbamate kinase
MSRIVIALGGNALGNTPDEQLERVQYTAKVLTPLIIAGHNLIICHGNGPQVGMINLAFEAGADAGTTPQMPLAECTAMSQGYIGYHLQNEIDAEIERNGLSGIPVVTMLTQTIVDEHDPAFKKPTKPIGPYYSEEKAQALMRETGDRYIEDSGRGWRKVVASPKPIGIYETISLQTLFYAREVIIAGGGGGIPIVRRGHRYVGVDAVVDKDFAASKLAELIDADYFIILTAVDQVALDFGKPTQRGLREMTTDEARTYIAEGQFAPGSMLPKVEAAICYAEAKKGRSAIITSLEKSAHALEGPTGTTITCPHC